MGLWWPNNVNANSTIMGIMFQGLHNDSKNDTQPLLTQLLLHTSIWSLRYKITLTKQFNRKSRETTGQHYRVFITKVKMSTGVEDNLHFSAGEEESQGAPQGLEEMPGERWCRVRRSLRVKTRKLQFLAAKSIVWARGDGSPLE